MKVLYDPGGAVSTFFCINILKNLQEEKTRIIAGILLRLQQFLRAMRALFSEFICINIHKRRARVYNLLTFVYN